MRYVVIAYLDISVSDYELIQEIRKHYDNQYNIVDQHFTIVFPTSKLEESDFIRHTKQHLEDVAQIKFILDKAIVKENTFTGHFQVHLVSTEKILGIVDLHDKLYTEELTSELKTDIEYVPHITIADSTDKTEMEILAAKFKGKTISGSLDAITVGSFDGSKVVNIQEFSLRSR